MTVTYHVGDSRAVIATIPDGSVDLIASSPPFLALRSYLPAGHEAKGDEIGSEANPAAFLDTLLALTAEWGRVLAPHGSLAIELGDTYSGGGGEVASREHRPERDGTGADGGARVVPIKSGDAWPLAKSLALIPQLYAVALAYGINPLTGQPSPAGRWRVRNVIVWHRPNPAVGALGDKVRPSTSYIVVATRSKERWFDLTAVRTEYAPLTMKVKGEAWANGDRGFKTGPKAASGNNGTPMPESRATHAGAPPLDAWFDSETTGVVPFDHHDGDLEHDTWTLTTQPSSLAHYAMWPAKLAERLILMMCPHEVCRVCGEPRRRMERTTNAVGKAVRSRADGRHGRDDCLISSFSPDRAERDTLGWTDCGCKCSTCGGTHLLNPRNPALPRWEEICTDCTDGRAFRPGLVLDPFCGTSTTMCVAELHGRDSIGIDLDPRNRDLMPRRMEECKRALFGTQPELPGQLDMFEVPA